MAKKNSIRRDNAKVLMVQLIAQCVGCKHKWTMTTTQILTAQEDGTATCPKCGSPAAVEGARST